MAGSCSGCNNFITLRWLNTIGGWESWTFTARHSYGVDVSRPNTFNVDIFNNWDTDFITGRSSKKTLSINAAKTITLRSGGLTEDQAEGLSTLGYAIAVQTVAGEGVTGGQDVEIDRRSFNYKTDREKNIELSFKITLPEIQIQTA